MYMVIENYMNSDNFIFQNSNYISKSYFFAKLSY